MTTKPTEKIAEALSQLLEGYAELQEALEQEYGNASKGEEDDDDDFGGYTMSEDGCINYGLN